ncbi:hypothetical protein ACFQGT_17910 [Natrialbaceae archaeon GCM10025810]|uniref:hypothetical protein n=1 Tax=Halovalidus salilacus TaxID=3075124 RepID=UPI003621D568
MVVSAGALEPSPEYKAYPDVDDLGANADDDVGQEVAVSGVVETDPVFSAVAPEGGSTAGDRGWTGDGPTMRLSIEICDAVG